jgi:UDP-glucose 4-epimerase
VENAVRALITGGAGFIGSHLAEYLLQMGDDVVILDDLSTGTMQNLEQVSPRAPLAVLVGSVLDPDLVRRAIAACDVVFHLAGSVGRRLAADHPVQTMRTNLRGTDHLLAAAREFDKPVLLGSTGDIEDRLAQAYFHEYRLPVVVARTNNTTGPRQSAWCGTAMPTLIDQALREMPLTIFGDGEQSRSFSYIGDIVGGLAALIANPAARGQIVSLDGAGEISMNALAERIVTVLGSASPIEHRPDPWARRYQFADERHRHPDNVLAAGLINFAPRTTIEEIILHVADSLLRRRAFASSYDAGLWAS